MVLVVVVVVVLVAVVAQVLVEVVYAEVCVVVVAVLVVAQVLVEVVYEVFDVRCPVWCAKGGKVKVVGGEVVGKTDYPVSRYQR